MKKLVTPMKSFGNLILMAVICIVIFWVVMALRPAHAQVMISGPPCGVPSSYETDANVIAAYNRCRARYYAEMNCNVGDQVACLRLKLMGKELPKSRTPHRDRCALVHGNRGGARANHAIRTMANDHSKRGRGGLET